MDWTETKWNNTTYYDDDGLKYLIERLYRSINSLAHVGDDPPLPEPIVIIVRYYGGKQGSSKASLKWRVLALGSEWAQSMELRLRIARRKGLYASDLEALGGLTSESPTIPEEALVDLCSAVLHTRHWKLNNLIRNAYRNTDYPNKKDEEKYTWPKHAVHHHILTEVLPSAQVLIHPKAKKGAAKKARHLNLKDKVKKLSGYAKWYALEIPKQEKELERLRRGQEQGVRDLASHLAELALMREEE